MVNFISPVGRIVQGSMFKPKTTDINNQPLVYKTGAQAGQPRVEYYFGLAISKQDPGLAAFNAALGEAAAAGWPGGQAGVAGFSWKMIDGDQLDGKGVPYANREGHAGHVIYKFSGSFAPRCNVSNGPGSWAEVAPESIKTGDYVRVSGSAEGNKNQTNPGIYLNYDQIEHVGVGTAIASGPTAADAFSQAGAAALPPGATAPAAPAAPFAGAAPAAMPGAAPVAAAPVAAAPVAAAPVAAAPVAAAPVAAAPVAAAPVAAAPVAAAPVAAAPVAMAPVAAPVAAAPIAVAPAAAPNPGFAQPPVA